MTFNTSPANCFSCTFTPGTTLWRVLTYNAAGNLGAYATVAAALAAGQTLFPPWGMVRRLHIRVLDSARTGPGSSWSYALNRGDPDFGNLGSDALRTQVSNSHLGTDDVVIEMDSGFEMQTLWLKVGSATDVVTIQVLIA